MRERSNAQEGGRASLGGSTVKNLPAMQEPREMWVDPWVGKIPWRRARQHIPVFLTGESHGQRSLVATVHGVAETRT